MTTATSACMPRQSRSQAIVPASRTTSPNLNLADGFLAIVAIALGFVLALLHAKAGEAVIIGTFASWLFSALEKQITLVPIYASNATGNMNNTK